MWKKLLLALSFVIGIAAFCAIPYIVGAEKMREGFRDTGWLCLGIFVLVVGFSVVAPAAGWTILMRAEGLKIPFRDAVAANLMGFPLALITPGFYLGGEPIKLIYLSKKHDVPKRRVLATIIVSKFQEFGGLLLVTLGAAGVALWRSPFARQRLGIVIGGTALILIPFLIGLVGFLGNYQLTVKFVNFLSCFRIARRKLARLRSRAREMEVLIHAAFTKRWKTFLAAQAMTLTSAVSILMRPWIFLYFAKERIVLGGDHLAMIYIITNFFNSIQITPGALGFFDGGIVGYFELTKLGAGNGLAFSLATRIADVVLSVFGVWLIAHLGLSRVARGVAKGEEKVSAEEVSEAIRSEQEATQNEGGANAP